MDIACQIGHPVEEPHHEDKDKVNLHEVEKVDEYEAKTCM